MRLQFAIIVLGAIFMTSCENCRENFESGSCETLDQLVNRTLLSGKPTGDADWQALRSYNFPERRRAVQHVLQHFLSPVYTKTIRHVAICVALQIEFSVATCELGKLLRQHLLDKDGDEIRVLIESHGVYYWLPEYFDVWADFAGLSDEDERNIRLEIRATLVGNVAIHWSASDFACEALWTRMRKVIPNCEKYEYYSTSTIPLELQAAWRSEIPKWLKEHPEAKSYWVQLCYDDYVNIYRSQVNAMQSTAVESKRFLSRLEDEFSFELADRRGICSGFRKKSID